MKCLELHECSINSFVLLLHLCCYCYVYMMHAQEEGFCEFVRDAM